MPESTETIPTQDGSLDSAADAFAGLLSQVEKKEKVESKPEPVKTLSQSEPQQAEPEETIEAPKSEVEGEVETPAVAEPRKLKVKIDGIEQELPEDEVVNGYSRTADYTRKTQELARQRKEFEERDVAAVRAERQQYQTHLAELKTTLESLSPKKPDFEKLKLTLPADQYAAKIEEWHAYQEKIAQVEKTQAEIKERQDQDAQRGFQARLADEHRVLREKLPDLADPVKGPILAKDLTDFAISRGYQAEELGQVTDHRAFLLLHDAMLGAKAKAKAPEVKNKIEKAMTSTPPGPSKSTQPKANRYDEAAKRLRTTGSLDSAADALDALIQKVG